MRTCRETFYCNIVMARFVIGIIESKPMRCFHRVFATLCPGLLNELTRSAAGAPESVFPDLPTLHRPRPQPPSRQQTLPQIAC